MSYILDALKKSDRERQRGVEPVLRSIHSEFSSGPRDGRSGSRALLLVLVLLLTGVAAAAGVWFARTSLQRGDSQVPPVAFAKVPQPAAEQSGVAPAIDPIQTAASVAPGAAPVTPASPPQQGIDAAAAAAGLPASVELLEIWQLSEAEQRYLQTLKVSLHVYSTDAAQRTVIINGLRVREGQPLGQDLELQEITSDGIILLFQGQRVHLSTVDI